jgi:REP element-mobilizing transposase RayT
MDEYQSLSHSRWECKYHVVFIPKCRRRTLYEELRRHLGEVFRRLAEQKESRIEEGHLMPDHVHMLISIPAEVRGVASDWVHQGEERDPRGSGVQRAEAQFCWAALLGAGLLRLDGGS